MPDYYTPFFDYFQVEKQIFLLPFKSCINYAHGSRLFLCAIGTIMLCFVYIYACSWLITKHLNLLFLIHASPAHCALLVFIYSSLFVHPNRRAGIKRLRGAFLPREVPGVGAPEASPPSARGDLRTGHSNQPHTRRGSECRVRKKAGHAGFVKKYELHKEDKSLIAKLLDMFR